MSRYSAHKSTLAITLMLLFAPVGRAFADDCTTDPTIPCVVSGTNPDPQVVSGTGSDSPTAPHPKPAPQIVIGDLALIALLQMT
jgi:hypothetical protein